MKKLLYVMLLVLLLAGLVGCDQLARSPQATATPAPTPVREEDGAVVVEGSVVPRDYSRLYTRTGGKVEEVLVSKGDMVSKDAPLVRLVTYDEREQAEAALAAAKLEQVNAQKALDDLTEKAQLASTEALSALAAANKALIEAQQRLADLDTNTYRDDLDKLQTDVGTAKKELDDAQEEWDKYKDLDVSNQTRRDQKKRFDDAQKKYDDAVRDRDLKVNELNLAKAEEEQAKSALEDAQREADKRKDGAPDPSNLALAQARLDNAKAQVTAAQKVLDGTTVLAPFGGTVVELDHGSGETVLPNQQLALVADLEELYVETTDLTEMDVVKLREGDSARISPDALDDLTLPATITEIAANSGKKGGDVTYTVRLKLDGTDNRLRWGMTVEVRFARQ